MYLRRRAHITAQTFCPRPTRMKRTAECREPHLRLPNHRDQISNACHDFQETKEFAISSGHWLVDSRRKVGNHPFRSAARVVQRQRREYLNNLPRRGFAHVGVELRVPAQSTGHRCPDASVADPRFQRICCHGSGLNITRNWDGTSSRRTTVSTAIKKNCARKHSQRSSVI